MQVKKTIGAIALMTLFLGSPAPAAVQTDACESRKEEIPLGGAQIVSVGECSAYVLGCPGHTMEIPAASFVFQREATFLVVVRDSCTGAVIYSGEQKRIEESSNEFKDAFCYAERGHHFQEARAEQISRCKAARQAYLRDSCRVSGDH